MTETVMMAGLAIVLALSLYTVYAVGALSRKVEGTDTPPPSSGAGASARGSARPAVQEGIPQQTVAVISAAIAAYMAQSAPGVPYAVRGIARRASGARPVWGFAGMRQNTEPF